MFRCLHHCDETFSTQLDRIEHLLVAVLRGEKIMTDELGAELTGIESAQATEKADVERVAADLEALEAKEAAGTLTDDERARLEAIRAEAVAEDATLVAADPVVTPPVDGSGDGSTPPASDSGEA